MIRPAIVHAFLVLACCCSLGATDLHLSRLFCDHMVMQRQMPVPVWGWAAAGAEVVVTIDGQEKKAVADKDRKWMVRLDPLAVGEPRKLSVRCDAETLAVSDILVGEVWLCAGQSNMEWPLTAAANAPAEIAAADHPNLRLFEVGNDRAPDGPVDRLTDHYNPKEHPCTWRVCSPDTAKMFSASGYFFGRDLQQALKVPVGLVFNAVGATPIESWISREALLADADAKNLVLRWERMVAFAETPPGKAELDAVFADYDAKQKAARAKNEWVWRSDAYQAPSKRLGYPSTFFNGRVNTLIPYAMRGVIWYQGEGNTGMGHAYRRLLPMLIQDWRQRWGQGDFPFLYVQLANWGGNTSKDPSPSEWAELRESQLLTLKVPHTAMAVAIDIGDAGNIHPKNKQDVGRRLALAARATVYGESIVHSGPIYRSMRVDGGSIRLAFDHLGGGLMAKDGALQRFEIAGADRTFVWATAVIDGDAVVVRSDAVTQPVAVRYAWSHNPVGCNLFNKEGLPASPFRTDDWPGVTTAKTYTTALDKPISFTLTK